MHQVFWEEERRKTKPRVKTHTMLHSHISINLVEIYTTGWLIFTRWIFSCLDTILQITNILKNWKVNDNKRNITKCTVFALLRCMWAPLVLAVTGEPLYCLVPCLQCWGDVLQIIGQYAPETRSRSNGNKLILRTRRWSYLVIVKFIFIFRQLEVIVFLCIILCPWEHE